MPRKDQREGRRFPEDLYSAVWLMFNRCPFCHEGGLPSDTKTIRTSQRSITLSCRGCGMQWTMTAHVMGRVAEKALNREEQKDKPYPPFVSALRRIIDWADQVDEHRGRPWTEKAYPILANGLRKHDIEPSPEAVSAMTEVVAEKLRSSS